MGQCRKVDSMSNDGIILYLRESHDDDNSDDRNRIDRGYIK